MQITIYTDGACDIHAENQPGGWAAILLEQDESGKTVEAREIAGGIENTTNNRMELTAVIEALKALREPTKVTVHTDSRYVIDVATGTNRIHKNRDLWQKYFSAEAWHTVRWQFVQGHAGDEYNERCDRLAVAERKKLALASQPLESSRAQAAERQDSKPESATHVEEGSAAVAPETSTVRVYFATKTSTRHSRAAWVAYMVEDDTVRLLGGVLQGIENYELCLIGAIGTVGFLSSAGSARIFTSNNTLASGANSWVENWANNDWTYLSGEENRPVRHKERWQKLQQALHGKPIVFEYNKEVRHDPMFKVARKLAATLLEQAQI